MSRLTRDGTAEPVSRDQILRHARGQGNIDFPCSADHEQDWQPYPVDPYSAICDDHTYTYKREDNATRAKAGGEASLDFWVIRNEPESRGICQRAGSIIGSVDSARRGALVRQVPPAEEPAESAAKKRQYERSHWAKERDG